MKRGVLFLSVLVLLIMASAAMAVEYPVYGCCTGERVNVREQPDKMVPSRGRLIHNAPVVVLSDQGDTYYCSTCYGEGYIPKRYIQLFEGMTDAEYAEYCEVHPNQYRKHPTKGVNENAHLLDLYYAGIIDENYLKEYWYCEPYTGYTGLAHDKDGKLYVFRGCWWGW